MIATGAIWAAVAWASTTVRVDGPKDASVTLEKEEARFLGRYVINGERQNVNGYSLQRVLDEAKVERGEWTRVFVEGLEISRDDEFNGDRVPAFAFRKNTDDVFFIKPAQGDEPAQTKAFNSFDLNYRIPVEIESDPDLDDAKAGDTVTFTASVPGPESSYTFEWDANGETGTGRKFKYTLPSSGGEVTVNVEGINNGDVQAEETISTKVAEPPSETGGTGTTGTGFGTGPSFGTDSYTPPSGDFDTNFPDVGDSSSDFPDAPKAPKTDITPTEETGTPVTGELLSATGALPPSSGDAAEPLPVAGEDAPADPTEVSEEAKEVSAPGALIASGIIVGLLGLGAGREMENVRPRRLRRPDLSGLRRLSPPWK
jgi:hypothetical protein